MVLDPGLLLAYAVHLHYYYYYYYHHHHADASYMCPTSNKLAFSRVQLCESIMLMSLYWTGMRYPPKGTNLAPYLL